MRGRVPVNGRDFLSTDRRVSPEIPGLIDSDLDSAFRGRLWKKEAGVELVASSGRKSQRPALGAFKAFPNVSPEDL